MAYVRGLFGSVELWGRKRRDNEVTVSHQSDCWWRAGELVLRMCVGFRVGLECPKLSAALALEGMSEILQSRKRWQARHHLVDRPLKVRLMTSYSQIGFRYSNWIGQRELNVESTDHREPYRAMFENQICHLQIWILSIFLNLSESQFSHL